MKIIFNVTSSALSLTSKMCTVMNFQNLKVVHLKKFFEEELVKVENGK